MTRSPTMRYDRRSIRGSRVIKELVRKGANLCLKFPMDLVNDFGHSTPPADQGLSLRVLVGRPVNGDHGSISPAAKYAGRSSFPPVGNTPRPHAAEFLVAVEFAPEPGSFRRLRVPEGFASASHRTHDIAALRNSAQQMSVEPLDEGEDIAVDPKPAVAFPLFDDQFAFDSVRF